MSQCRGVAASRRHASEETNAPLTRREQKSRGCQACRDRGAKSERPVRSLARSTHLCPRPPSRSCRAPTVAAPTTSPTPRGGFSPLFSSLAVQVGAVLARRREHTSGEDTAQSPRRTARDNRRRSRCDDSAIGWTATEFERGAMRMEGNGDDDDEGDDRAPSEAPGGGAEPAAEAATARDAATAKETATAHRALARPPRCARSRATCHVKISPLKDIVPEPLRF